MNRTKTGLLCSTALSAIALPLLAAAQAVYSPGGWATLHRDPANRKLVREVTLSDHYESWHALAGAAVLTAPTLSPDGRTLYVTTGKARGHRNLHAFSLEGERLWQSPPWGDAVRDLDPCAILSSPIVDANGVVYINDCNQLFAFRPGGELAWQIPLPAPRPEDWLPSEELKINAFTTPVFTNEGRILGVTNFGDVVVVDRGSGRVLNEAFRLPGLVPPASSVVPLPDGTLSGGAIDPQIREWVWQLIFGGHMRSANTPAVDVASGRVFVAATSTSAGKGALYGLDLIDEGERVRIEIAFATEMGPGSGSSPALSLDGRTAYVSDEEGMFYAVDGRSGEVLWRVQTQATAAAAAVGADGDVYALQANGPALVSMSPAGEIRWQSDLSELTAAALPSTWLLGDPVAIGNGNPTVVGGLVLVPVLYGYQLSIGRDIPLPIVSSLVAIDVKTGRGVRDIVALRDDSSGITAVLPDGSILSSLGGTITSSVGPLAPIASWLLPGERELLAPVLGLQVSRPLR